MKIEITSLGNAAFCNPYTGEPSVIWAKRAVSNSLREFADQLDNDELLPEGYMIDLNGNRVGRYTIQDVLEVENY